MQVEASMYVQFSQKVALGLSTTRSRAIAGIGVQANFSGGGGEPSLPEYAKLLCSTHPAQ